MPGCFPTREMVNGATAKPVYVINGFDYVESDADARSIGGFFWRIDYGRITVPGAARRGSRHRAGHAGHRRQPLSSRAARSRPDQGA